VQGGFVPQSYIELLQIQPLDTAKYNEYLRKNFFDPDTKVYRGTISTEPVTEQDLVRMFEEVVGLTTGYSTIRKGRSNTTTSPRPISQKAVIDTLVEYNTALAGQFLHAEGKVKKDTTKEFKDIVQDHV